MIVPATRPPLDKERQSMRHIYKMLVDGDECANHKAAISQRAAVLKLCRATLEVHRTPICGKELHASPKGLGCKPKFDLMIVPTTRPPLDKERPSMLHI